MIIFVAGIHGAGKSTCCAEAATQLGLRHLTASSVIKAEKASAISSSTKVVTNVDGNQELLIQGVQKLRQENVNMLLDGHMTLRTPTGIAPIPVQVFKDVEIEGLILMLAPANEIQARLDSRDGQAPTLAQIEDHQAAEHAHACVVAKAMNIPFATLHPATTEALVRDIYLMLPRGRR